MGGALRKFCVRFCVGFTTILLIIQFSSFVPWLLNRLVGPDWTNPDGDILIVLTADEPLDDMMGTMTYPRGLYGVRAWREGHFHAAVVCGSEAAAVGQFLNAYDVPKEKIFLEERAYNTHDCALQTKQMIASWPGRRVLVTGDTHIFRAKRAFQAAGLPVEARPFPDLLKYWDGQQWRIPESMRLFSEIGKIGYYRARGWIRL
ncbi:MAG TPA: YdcF family protein [Bryobacteraceae bacterium]|jgi:uncharacterized SAM-binding protein YcdF (DUF218 family)